MWAFVIPNPDDSSQREPHELADVHPGPARRRNYPLIFFLADSDSERTHGTLLRSDALVTCHFECERPGGRQDSGTLSCLEVCFRAKVSLAPDFYKQRVGGREEKIAERFHAPLRELCDSSMGLKRDAFRHLSDC